jgi:hypothetical protein
MTSTLRRCCAGLLAAALLAAIVTGCGGGVGTGGTGSFASGPITGFGSVIVNDIVFDDSSASIEDGDGSGRSRTELRLGMTVEIDSDAIASGAARASRIRFDSALLGPVEAVDRINGSFSVLGQTVFVDDTTVYDDVLTGRLGAVLPGQTVEVYGVFDAALQRYRATRIERRLVAPIYRVRGLVTQVDATAETLRIGGAIFSYGGATQRPSDLAAGQFVRLALRTTQVVGRWPVLSFSTALRPVGELDGVVLKGLVTAFVSAASFHVDGRPVNASNARFEGGAPALGLRVEVEGPVRAGVLLARTVSVRSDSSERERGFELRGAIESVNAAQGSFVLRGVTVSTARSDLRYDNGSAADLTVGRRVEVRGALAGNGVGLEATRIKFP